MYIIIYEDGEVQSSPTCDEDLLLGADDGVVDLLDVSDPENPIRRWDGEWQPIESVIA